MPDHLRDSGVVIWDDGIAHAWAFREWVDIHARRPDAPVVANTEEAIRFVIKRTWLN